MLDFLHNDMFLKIAGLIVGPAAIAVKSFCPPYTVASHAADYALQGLALLGVYSTTGRTAR